MTAHTTARLWQCHLDARAAGSMPPPPAPVTQSGRAMAKAALEQARAMTSKTARATEDRKGVTALTSWRDTPYDSRRVVAMLAGLPPSVADKTDRQLSETEKAMLRSAARRLSDGITGLAKSL